MHKSKTNLLNISCLFFAILILITFAQANTVNAQAQSIGKIIELKGDVSVIREGGEKISASIGLQIFRDDEIRTGRASSAKIEFTDKTVLTLFENSEIKISEFVYTPSTGKRDTVVDLVKGQVRSVVTKTLAEDSSYKVKTRNAVMGIRGTTALSKFQRQLFSPVTVHALVEGVAFAAKAGQDPYTEGTPLSKGMQATFVGSKDPVIEMMDLGDFPSIQEEVEKKPVGAAPEGEGVGEGEGKGESTGKVAAPPTGEGEKGEPEAMAKEAPSGGPSAKDVAEEGMVKDPGDEGEGEGEGEPMYKEGPSGPTTEGTADKAVATEEEPAGEDDAPEAMAKEVDSMPSAKDAPSAAEAIVTEPGEEGGLLGPGVVDTEGSILDPVGGEVGSVYGSDGIIEHQSTETVFEIIEGPLADPLVFEGPKELVIPCPLYK